MNQTTRRHPFHLETLHTTLAVVAALGLWGCSKPEEGTATAEAVAERPAADTPSMKGTRVEVAIVEPSRGALTIRVPGEVEGIRDAMLSAPLGGYIEQVAVEEGQRVKSGAVLARVDSQTHSTRLLRAQVERKAAERERERAESLKGTIPQAEIDAAGDRVDAANATLRELQVNVERSIVKAPFAGVVVKVDAEVGEVAAPGSPLFRLVQLNPVHVSVALSDRDMAVARVGMPATVELDARSGVFNGKVVRVTQAADVKTRSFEAIVEVDNPTEELLPGMIAQVMLSSGDEPESASDAGKLLISQDWVVTELDGVGVFVEENGKAAWRPVKLGQVMRRQVEVLDGLHAGDHLIIVGHRSLAAGDTVLVQRTGRCCEAGRAVFSESPAGTPSTAATGASGQ